MSCLVCKAIFVFAVACKTLIFSHHPPGPNLFQNIRRIFISSGRRVQQRNITLSESRMCILFSEWPQQWSDGVYLDSWISCKNAKLLPKLPTFNVEISVSHNAFWVVGVILFVQLKMNNELEGLLSTIHSYNNSVNDLRFKNSNCEYMWWYLWPIYHIAEVDADFSRILIYLQSALIEIINETMTS